MRVVIIGSGNVAAVLGRKILLAGHRITQVIGRDRARTAELAGIWNCPFALDWGALVSDAELYIVALSDDALPGFAKAVRLPDRLVLHTAGAVSGKVLEPVSARSGVLYPLQSLRRETGLDPGSPIPEIPILISANDPGNLPEIREFARTLSEMVQVAEDRDRARLHLAAVLVNNFTNHLYTQAAAYCAQEKVDFDLLVPLIGETANRLRHMRPADAQTGPAARGDRATIERHLRELDKYQAIKELYALCTIQIEEKSIL